MNTTKAACIEEIKAAIYSESGYGLTFKFETFLTKCKLSDLQDVANYVRYGLGIGKTKIECLKNSAIQLGFKEEIIILQAVTLSKTVINNHCEFTTMLTRFGTIEYFVTDINFYQPVILQTDDYIHLYRFISLLF